MKSFKVKAKLVNWFFLGILMLTAGLVKLLVTGPVLVEAMLNGMGIPAPGFFTWVLIFGEILSGVLILARWNLRYITYVPMVILTVAAFTSAWGKWSTFLLHFVAVSSYWVLGQEN
jgi:uncharacterized membrane protein YphA (DoxX/SURF4 family)